MPNPILIIPTRSGYAVAELSADQVLELPINVSDLQCFNSLRDSVSYLHDGALQAIERHFAAPVEQTELKVVA